MTGRLLAVLLAAGFALLPVDACFGQQSLEQARQARFAGNLDLAERLLRETLRADRDNYMGLYNMGLVYEARAVRAPPGEPRLAHYRTCARWLEQANARRISGRIAEYTIFSSLGTCYLGVGDLVNAGKHLSEGLRNQSELDDSARGRLFANVGYLYALRGNNEAARRYFAAGARLGSDFARKNLERLGGP